MSDMIFSGPLKKMASVLSLDGDVSYFFSDYASGELNRLIGHEISLRFDGEILCISCGKKISKTFFNGFCYPCLKSSPEASDCVTRPELCRAHLNQGRDLGWELSHHNQPHVVYLSNTSGVKVGVTSVSHLPMRWIDQGATEALVIAKTPNRFEAGVIEVALKQYVSDKTHWQRMLTTNHISFDLKSMALELSEKMPRLSLPYLVLDEKSCRIKYPVNAYHEKIKTINLDKTPTFSEQCIGIKGQYLLFESGMAFHVRKHSGYVVTVTSKK